MPRTHGRIEYTIWRDKDFRALTRNAQTMYMQLVSQNNVNSAGVLPLMVKTWARGCDELTEQNVWDSLNELQETKFAFYDDDTDETLIRSHVRNDGIAKQPNLFKNALRCAEQVESPKLRVVLAGELRRLKRKDADEIAATLDPDNADSTPFERHSNADSTPFERDPNAERHSDAIRIPSGVGVGEGVGEPSLLGYVGEGRATEPSAGAHDSDAPPPRCPKHLNNPTDAPCRACGIARQRRETWDREDLRLASEAKADEHRRRAEAVRAERANCPLGCADTDGYINGRVCDHNPDQADTNRRGIALVRSALPKNGTDS